MFDFSYFHKSGDNVVKKQTSVIRTNCMDCLDRTNVVQSTFAKYMLIQQLIEVGILDGKDDLEKHTDFMFIYRNGNFLIIYSNLKKKREKGLVGLISIFFML